jgi:hypothetical protein
MAEESWKLIRQLRPELVPWWTTDDVLEAKVSNTNVHSTDDMMFQACTDLTMENPAGESHTRTYHYDCEEHGPEQVALPIRVVMMLGLWAFTPSAWKFWVDRKSTSVHTSFEMVG